MKSESCGAVRTRQLVSSQVRPKAANVQRAANGTPSRSESPSTAVLLTTSATHACMMMAYGCVCAMGGELQWMESKCGGKSTAGWPRAMLVGAQAWVAVFLVGDPHSACCCMHVVVPTDFP